MTLISFTRKEIIVLRLIAEYYLNQATTVEGRDSSGLESTDKHYKELVDILNKINKAY